MAKKRSLAVAAHRHVGAEAYATALEIKWMSEGVEPDLAKELAEKFYAKTKSQPGVPLYMLERAMLRELLEAQRESQIRRLPAVIAERYHLPVGVVRAALKGAVEKLMSDPKLLVRVVLAQYEDQLQQLSKAHFEGRRRATSPLAAAILKSG